MNFREYAQRKTTLSELMENREKMETRNIIGKELTICDFDIAADRDGNAYSVFICREYPDNFFFGGMVLTDIFTGYIAEVGMETAKSEIRRDGLRVRLSNQNTKTGGRSYTKVEVI